MNTGNSSRNSSSTNGAGENEKCLSHFRNILRHVRRLEDFKALVDLWGKDRVERILSHVHLYLRSEALTERFGVAERDFRKAIDRDLRHPRTKKLYFLDILGAHAWAHPLFHRYLYEQASIYAARNHTTVWNLQIEDELLQRKIEERLLEANIDIDDVMPDYFAGDTINLSIVRILLWEDEDIKSDIAQDLIELHRAFNIPLFYLPPRAFKYLFGGQVLEYHVATDESNQPLPNGCWIYADNKRLPFEDIDWRYPEHPLKYIQQILADRECVFALEKRKELMGDTRRKRRVLFINSPTRDTGGFRGSPTSLLYAIGPLIEEIKAKRIDVAGFSHLNIVDPTYFTDKTIDNILLCVQAVKPDFVGISTTSDALQSSISIAEAIKAQREGVIVILGGPHCDEVNFLEPDNPNNPLNERGLIDFVVSGDGEFILLNLIKVTLEGFAEWNATIGSTEDIETIKRYVKEQEACFREASGKGRLYFLDNRRLQTVQSSWNDLNLELMPPLRYEYIKKKHLRDFNIFLTEKREVKKCVQIMTHRGCRGLCNFCSERMLVFGEPFFNKSKSVQKVIDEIYHYVTKLGIEAVFFDDSTFIENPSYVEDLCKELVRSGLSSRITWGCLNRFDRVHDPRLLKTMVLAGLEYMYMGLELFDNEALGRMQKNIIERNSFGKRIPRTKRDIKSVIIRALDMLKEKGVKVGVSILFGIPEENEDPEKETIAFVGKMVEEDKIGLVSLSLFNYHLGSTLTVAKLAQRDLDYSGPGEDLVEKQGRPPWNCFEEAGWFHADILGKKSARRIDESYLNTILQLVGNHIQNKGVLVRQKEIEEALKTHQ